MLNHDKVKLMTQLAIYEKNSGKTDKEKMEYFKTDYISYNNFKTQISVTIALIIILGVEFTKVVTDHLANITEYNFVALGVKYLIIWVIFIGIYTMISSLNNRIDYSKAKKRTNEYEKMLKKLEKMQ